MTRPLSRRRLLGSALGGFFAFCLRERCPQLVAAQPQGKAKRCVVLWMNGGPSQLDTFDPKPGAETGGEFNAISTAAPGLSICETLPRISQQMNRLSVLRCLTSTEGEHLRGQHYLHTGWKLVEAFPRPALGAIVSHQSPPAALPKYVTLGGQGFGPAWLGAEHAPFAVEDADQALELLRRVSRRRSHLHFARQLSAPFDRLHQDDRLQRRAAMTARIEALADTSFAASLDWRREPETTRRRYGDGAFGRRCLLARRLLEAGVPFVEVQHDGWDTHQNNFPRVRQLCGEIDQPWAALMDDLAASGLLDETVVLWLGEFGRTPSINGAGGRDHFPQVTPAVLGGGPIAGGLALGQTNKLGTEIQDEPVHVGDLFATILSALGIDPQTEFTTSFGSPAAATDAGQPIAALFR